jgi:hypothetical protein
MESTYYITSEVPKPPQKICQNGIVIQKELENRLERSSSDTQLLTCHLYKNQSTHLEVAHENPSDKELGPT